MLNKRKVITSTVLSLLLISVIFYLLQLNWISITKETVLISKLPKEFDHFEILQLSDLHNKEFGKGNKKLVNKINEIAPDIIVITGDMMTNTMQKRDTGNILIEFLENLNGSYPIYYVTGEHEEGQYYEDRNKYQQKGTKEKYEERLSRLGVHVLNDASTKIKRDDSLINLYGLKEHLSGEIQIEERLGKINKQEVNLLLSHRPHYFEEYSDWGADLTFSGDTHGGMIRLPFVGGIFSTEGLFPEYDGGLFQKKNSTMVVSRGLGNHPIPLRVFNRPDLVVVTLEKNN